jgi:2-C-methyl-D-erythritol 4-phosphate cytidylyltransferase
MGAAVPKALLPLAGRPLVEWSLDALVAAPEVDGIFVMCPPGHEDVTRVVVGDRGVVVPGGSTRSRSVAAGLAALPRDTRHVLVHDAARPLVTAGLIAEVLASLEGADGAIAAAPLADTLKREGPPGEIGETVDRQGLWCAQTPQAFHQAALAAAFANADDEALDAATDCAWLVERNGGHVRLVDPGRPNLKVTTPADLLVAEALLAGRM